MEASEFLIELKERYLKKDIYVSHIELSTKFLVPQNILPRNYKANSFLSYIVLHIRYFGGHESIPSNG